MLRVGVLLIMVSVATSGCQLLGPDQHGHRTDIERARDAWAGGTGGDYAFDLFRSCFCVYAGRFRVEVENYEIQSVMDLLSARPAPITDFRSFLTIEEMFDLVEDAREQQADVVEVEFADRGYPTRINLDYSGRIADDELLLEVENVDTDG